MNFWDQSYSVDGYKYGVEPNAFLKQEARRLNPSSQILVPGDGEGRNGIWLAQQGHRVLALDSSSVGQAKARQLAIERNAHLSFELTNLEHWKTKAGSFDAAVLTYVHLPLEIRTAVHRQVAHALKPGGLLILEAFHPRQLGYASGGPKNEELLYTLAMLRDDFALLMEEHHGTEEETHLDEGLGHQGAAFVTRWIGARYSIMS